MGSFIAEYYNIFRALHLIAVISWMAGMFYLPRLFAYHAGVEKGSETSEIFKVMERKLLRFIMNPAMIATWIFGPLMIWGNPALLESGWIYVKLVCVFLMTVLHHVYGRWRCVFARDENEKSAKFYKFWNEAPTLLLIIIVFMVITKPF